METEPIELRFTVACSPAHAFGVDAMRTSLWWPTATPGPASPALSVTFEPRPGGASPRRLALLLDNCYR
jgi:hypothetical protein